jgi:hypothetical protein
MHTYYPEIHKAWGKGVPDYPETCPVCGAAIKFELADEDNGPIYECDGRYMKNLEEQNLLNVDATVWVVFKDGTRKHIAGFTISNLAESYANEISKSYPRYWDENPIDYFEVKGDLFTCRGKRFLNGELIAAKGIPHHLSRDQYDKYEPVWFKVKQLSVGHYKYGEIING